MKAAADSKRNTDHIYDLEPPPSYSESNADAPPLYDLEKTRSDCIDSKFSPSPPSYVEPHFGPALPRLMTKPEIDFEQQTGFRQATNKKNKKAQKAADQAKWQGSGDEGGDKEGGEGGEENGGGGGGSNNGDGGAGDNGGGGDDWNDWGTGKKKKGKKAKEEEKKKEEEEEEEAKKKAGETKEDPLSWANEEGDGDWGGFTATTKKDKKKKKDKVSDIDDRPRGELTGARLTPVLRRLMEPAILLILI